MAMNAKDEMEVRLYADACSQRFALRQDGETWVREFPTLREAIRFVTELPVTTTRKIILHDDQGIPLTRLTLRHHSREY